MYNFRRRHLNGKLQFCVEKSSCWRDLLLVVEIFCITQIGHPPYLILQGMHVHPFPCRSTRVDRHIWSPKQLPLCLVLTSNQLLICLSCGRSSSSRLSTTQIYTCTNMNYQWKTLTSHHFDDTIFTCLLCEKNNASKLNKGHQEQLEGVKWSPKTFLLVKVGLKSLDLGLIDAQNPKIIAELKWG